MAEQAYAYVTLIPVAKGFQSAVAKELGGAKGVGKTAGEQTGKTFSKGFAGPLKGLAVAVGGALAAVGVTQFFKTSIARASDLGESINAVTVSYGEFADDVLALGGDVASRLGLTTTDFNAAAVRFSAFAERVVGEGGNVAGFVDSITTRASDFASVFNIEVSEALQVFQSGLSGEAEPLKRFGINLLDSEVSAYAYRAGIASVGEALTETEKVQARYGLLLESTAKTAGDFANTSDGLANSQKILQANFSNLQAEVGENLAPVMATFVSSLVPLANEIFPKIANFVNTHLVPVLDRAAQNVRRLVGQFTSGYLDFDGVLDRITAKIRSFFEGGGLTDAFETLAGYRETMFNAVLEAVPGILEAFMEFLPQLVDFFMNTMLPRLLEQWTIIIRQLLDLVVTLLPQLVETLVEMIPELLDGAIALFNAIVDALIEITPLLIDAVIELMPKIIGTLLDMLPELIEASMELFEGIIEGLIDATPLIIDAVFDLIPVIIETLIENIPKIIDAGMELVKGLAKGIIDNAPRLLGEAVSSLGNNIVNGFKDFMGINSPARVMIPYGMMVSQGVAKGIEDETEAVTTAATNLGNAATSAARAAVEDFESTFEIITNIPQMLTSGMEEAFEFTVAQARKMAKEVEGFYAKFNEAGELQNVYTGYGVAMEVPAVGGRTLDVGKLTDDINALYKYAGAQTVAEMTQIQKDVFGGATLQQAIDAITGQAPVEGLAYSVDQLVEAVDNLSKAVDEKGLTPFANGGLVTGPTAALIGEAGPEVVIPLNRFESMMGLDGKGKTVNYYAAQNQSLDSEQALFQAMRRAKVVANW
jgi:AcrR family transcriptional regulator